MWLGWLSGQALVFLISRVVGSSPGLKTGVLRQGPVYCVMHVKEPSTAFVKRRGSPPVFLALLAALRSFALHQISE